MPISPQRAFLDELLAGHRPDEQRLHAFLDERVGGDPRRRVDEDLHLEFKAGDFADKGRRREDGSAPDPASELRQYVAGFANAEGGVLVLGVAEPSEPGGLRTLAPVKRWPGGRGAENGERWISDCLVALRPFLSPPPRVYVVEVEDGCVAVIAVPRSLALVACEEGGRLVHNFRLHDKTIAVPAYLVQDLVLGRRQQPVVEVTATLVRCHLSNVGSGFQFTAGLSFGLINRGLVWVDTPILGLITPGHEPNCRELTPELRSQIECGVLPPRNQLQFQSWPAFAHGRRGMLEPFGRLFLNLPHSIQWTSMSLAPYRWGAAVVLLSVGAAPAWYQLEAMVEPHGKRGEGEPLPRIGVAPVYEARPRLLLEPAVP